MGVYTTVEKVKVILGEDVYVDFTTVPSWNDVNEWILDVEATANVALVSGGSTAPATGDMVRKLGLACGREVAYQVMTARGKAGGDQNTDFDDWHDEFIALMEALATGEEIAGSVASGRPTSYTMEAPSSTDTSINPVFQRGKEF